LTTLHKAMSEGWHAANRRTDSEGVMLHSGAGVTAAADANDFLIYNATTGALYYDPDGNGDAAAVQFATLSAGLALTAGNFVVS
jgi:Ca2+-binding RTX toxin-like protein